MNRYEKSCITLELPAVLEMLAAQASSETAKDRCRALAPSDDRGEVLRRLAETGAAKQMMVLRGSPPSPAQRTSAAPSRAPT